MDALTAARLQMEVSLAFHMVFAALGITLPLLTFMAEGLHLRTGKPHYMALARQWGKALALLFAVGAVSGTALSFELGLLWPVFMEMAGGMVGPAFTLEGFAFFIEAIFIGIWLYGWDRLTPRQHWLVGLPIVVSGFMSGVFVVATNAWMQMPAGYVMQGEEMVSVDALAVFKSPMWLPMAFHLLVSCYVAAAWAVAGVYAHAMLRGKRDAYHVAGLQLSMVVAVAFSLLLVPSGDVSARAVAENQPIKLAAMEGLFETEAGAPLAIGGFPDTEAGVLRWAIEIPYMLSLLAWHDPQALVQGLEAFPRELWPNVPMTHIAFQVMVASGAILLAASAWYAWTWWRKRDALVDDRRLLWGVVVAAPFGFVGIETGWIVTEAGRQPWTIYNVLLTRDAVTSAAGVEATFWSFTVLYVVLGALLVFFLRHLARHGPARGSKEER